MNISPLGNNSLLYSNQTNPAKESFSAKKFSLPKTESNDTETFSNPGLMNGTIKNTGNLLRDSLCSFMDGAAEDGAITVDEIFTYAEKYYKKADQVLDETVNQLRIPPDVKITIDTNGEGGIKVSADLPEDTLKKLEQRLNEHPDFQQHYAKASSSYSFGKAAETQSEFTKAYEQNPLAAVGMFGLEYKPDFIMEYLASFKSTLHFLGRYSGLLEFP